MMAFGEVKTGLFGETDEYISPIHKKNTTQHTTPVLLAWYPLHGLLDDIPLLLDAQFCPQK
jgi:hypothetical protein